MTTLKEKAKNNVLVVTGASGGIGRAIAERGIELGYSLFLQGHTRLDELRQFASRQLAPSPTKTTNMKRTVEVFGADLSCEKEQDRFVDDVLNALTPTDYLAGWINAAGIDLMAPAQRDTAFDERLRSILALDVIATLRMSRRIGSWLYRNHSENKSSGQSRPLILCFGWDGALRGRRGETSLLYATAKGAVCAASKSLAQEFAPHVRVCTLSPGWIKTSWGKKASPQADQQACSESLSQRWGTAEEIASFVFYLLSPQGDFLNGENFVANGGFRVP